MKITDLRCGRVFEGDLVDTIPGNSQPDDETLEVYLGVRPGDSQYDGLKRGTTHKRMVLKHAAGYYVVPANPKFYKVEA